MRKNLDDVLINLKPEDVIRAQRIVMDGDAAEALRFMVDCLAVKIDSVVGRCG